MAILPGKFLLPFLLASLLSLAAAELSLDGSDRDAVLAVQRDFGYDPYLSQGSAPANPCTLAGIHCERRRDSGNGSSLVLRVTRIVLESRRLPGFLSPAIGRLSELKELSLPDNLLVDRIPPQIVGLKKLEILDLRNNRFSGEIPPGLSSLLRLRILDLSSNRFSGSLGFLKHFPNLEKLSLAENLFTGRIPASLRSFWNLRSFNFSGNSFLEGPAEQSSSPRVQNRYILAERSNATGTRNRSSAAAPQSSAQAPGPSAGAHKKGKKKSKKIGGWILGFAAGALAGCLSGLVCSVLFKLLLVLIKGRGKEGGPSIYSPLIKKAEDLAFLEKEDGLASMQMIGRGGCGEVYKAELPGSDGKMIAIKKIIQAPKDANELTEEDSKLLNKKMRQIRSEINTVSKIRHRNLLSLLAHVCRPDCHYLVYEFMKNGSLQVRNYT